jgi:site-specific DNA recombinase
LDDVKAGRIEAVLVTKLDRLSRNLADLLEMVRLFDRHGVALISTSETIDTGGAAGRMMLQLLGVFAEFERGRTSERIRDVLSDRRLQRKVYSRAVPFGFKRSGDDLVKDARQQAALDEARSMHSGGASYRQIAARMSQLGVTTNSGGRRWYPETIRQILGSRMSREETSQTREFLT